MNFQQLEYILAVDQHKNFGMASFSCDVSQATLSAMIKKLEQELDIIIFDRSRKPVRTTEEGEKIIALAKNILAGRREILDIKALSSEKITGTIRIGIIPTIASSLLPLILPTLLSEFPEVEFDITEITTENIKKALSTEHIDVGILATPLADDSLEENILYYEAMMVYGIRERKKYLSPHDILNQKVWLLEEDNCFRNQSVTICKMKEKAEEPKNLKFEASSFDTLISMTDRFGGFTVIPELYYNMLSEDKKERSKSFELPVPVREISMVYLRPYVKKKSIEIISEKIREIIEPHLSTSKLKPKDMEIIGI